MQPDGYALVSKEGDVFLIDLCEENITELIRNEEEYANCTCKGILIQLLGEV